MGHFCLIQRYILEHVEHISFVEYCVKFVEEARIALSIKYLAAHACCTSVAGMGH